MRAFVIEQGTKVNAVKFQGLQQPKIEEKFIKEQTLYFAEDIAIDPFGIIDCGPQNKTIGGQWASQGLYGFKLPANKSGYDLILVHATDITIG